MCDHGSVKRRDFCRDGMHRQSEVSYGADPSRQVLQREATGKKSVVRSSVVVNY